MKKDADGYGRQLLAQYREQTPTAEIIERDDNYIEAGSKAGLYFAAYDDWSDLERRAIDQARGKVLDIGCGAGRHSLYLQAKGFDVTGIDNSPGAIKVCKLRGLKKALVRSIDEIDRFKTGAFETILMLGNNFGLFGSPEKARAILAEMSRITAPHAQIIAATLNPYVTDKKEHLEYLKFNKRRGRLPGQIRMRVRYGKTVGEWFDYLFVSPEEMEKILAKTGWRIREFLKSERANYIALIDKI